MNAKHNVVRHAASVTRARREVLNGHRAAVVWFTGLSGAGKSTIAHATEERLFRLGCRTFVLDGDHIYHGLCSDLGFSAEDRRENCRRIGEVVELPTEAGVISLAAFALPFRQDRERVRSRLPHGDFLEVYCKCSLETCEQRDTEGLYRRARAGEVAEFTGISSPYEEPLNPDLVLDTDKLDVERCVDEVVQLLAARGVIAATAIDSDS